MLEKTCKTASPLLKTLYIEREANGHCPHDDEHVRGGPDELSEAEKQGAGFHQLERESCKQEPTVAVAVQ